MKECWSTLYSAYGLLQFLGIGGGRGERGGGRREGGEREERGRREGGEREERGRREGGGTLAACPLQSVYRQAPGFSGEFYVRVPSLASYS